MEVIQYIYVISGLVGFLALYTILVAWFAVVFYSKRKVVVEEAEDVTIAMVKAVAEKEKKNKNVRSEFSN